MKRPQVLLSREFTGQRLITLSIGFIFFAFGILKFFPDYSPAEDIAKRTIDVLVKGILSSNISYLLLAIWETTIGLMFILNYQRKAATILALVHLTFTFSTFFIFPELSFNKSPFSFTLLGQYIIKNIIILSVLISLLTEKTPSNDKAHL
ncbi:doxx family protein [Aestuariibaculum suncheonense]|uniref:Doxx family protein n=1 Tax=Aestuariibaculum suncheonense TaxID=1028745 RepID=A0A8J6UFW9_9FLAO|nr:doxx family protein [Aestuariibaculum suncheonense]MBD0834599.1 doxx family protein [Aestuariibaculum suncheonense]